MCPPNRYIVYIENGYINAPTPYQRGLAAAPLRSPFLYDDREHKPVLNPLYLSVCIRSTERMDVSYVESFNA